jgi:hypothetical protein
VEAVNPINNQIVAGVAENLISIDLTVKLFWRPHGETRAVAPAL